jgi:hypothetical protein
MCGNSQPAPSSSTSSVSELPDWAKGYAKDTLAKTAQLTDINKNPYKTYEGQRNAALSPMQTQAMQGAANMSAGPEAFSQGISGYMSPYMQNVVDIGKREATRQSGIQGTQQQAQATQAGAFGGSRDAIMRAERERNLGMQMSDIQDKGMQSAYDQAANQFRQGITQGMDVNKLQAGYGGMQQGQLQKELDTRYGDFTNQQNYPYKQLGFMSDMIRGLPIGTQGGSTVYQAPGSTLGQLGGLGVTALGLSKFMADGGEVHGYAGGGAISAGEDVDSEENIAGILHMKTDEQLKAAAQAAAQRGDQEELRLIQEEFAMRASLHNGLASVVPSNMTGEDVPAGANGGIVAFDKGGVTKNALGEEIDPETGYPVPLYRRALNALRDSPGYQNYREMVDNPYGYTGRSGPHPRNKPDVNETPAASQKFTGDSGFKEYVPPEQRKNQAAAGGGKGGGRPSGAISDNLHPAIAATVDKALADMAASGKVGGNSLLGDYKSVFDMISQGNNADLQVLKDQMTKGDQQVDETKGHALGNILMAFGANWAANASKPGAQFLSSAAASAPAAQQEMATQDKIVRDMNDVQNKIKMDYTKFQISLKKDDQKTAFAAAGDMQKNALYASQIAEQAATHRGEISLKGQQLELDAKKLAQDAAHQMGLLGVHRESNVLAGRRQDALDKDVATRQQAVGVREKQLRVNAAKIFDADPGNQSYYRDLKKNNPKDADFLMGQKRAAYISDTLGSSSGSGGIRDLSDY